MLDSIVMQLIEELNICCHPQQHLQVLKKGKCGF